MTLLQLIQMEWRMRPCVQDSLNVCNLQIKEQIHLLPTFLSSVGFINKISCTCLVHLKKGKGEGWESRCKLVTS